MVLVKLYDEFVNLSALVLVSLVLLFLKLFITSNTSPAPTKLKYSVLLMGFLRNFWYVSSLRFGVSAGFSGIYFIFKLGSDVRKLIIEAVSDCDWSIGSVSSFINKFT